MSDAYQAVYDAVRSRISGGNIGDIAREVMRDAFDFSYARESMVQEFSIAFSNVSDDMRRPSVLYRPTLSADGTSWCALLGENLQVGVAGFGDTPAEAMAAFDKAFLTEHTPAAIRAERKRG